MESATLCLAITNAIAPGLNRLDRENADKRVLTNIEWFLRREMSKRDLVNVPDELWIKWTSAAERAKEAGSLAAIPGLPKTKTELRKFVFPAEINYNHVKILFEHLLTAAAPAVSSLRPTTLFTATLLSFAKKGDISQRKLDSVLNQLEAEIGKRLDLTVGLIHDMWQKVGVHVP